MKMRRFHAITGVRSFKKTNLTLLYMLICSAKCTCVIICGGCLCLIVLSEVFMLGIQFHVPVCFCKPNMFVCALLLKVLFENFFLRQEFPPSWQPLQSHHATASLVGWPRHSPIQPDAQCWSGTCYEATLVQ